MLTQKQTDKNYLSFTGGTMSEVIFSIFPSENFVDMGLYQFGWEQCDPSQSFGPAARNHYLFHLCLSGTGTLYAENTKGESITYKIKSGQGFMLFPHQICTYQDNWRNTFKGLLY